MAFYDAEFDFYALSVRQREAMHDLHVGLPVRNSEAIESLMNKNMVYRTKDGELSITPAAHPFYKKWIAGILP